MSPGFCIGQFCSKWDSLCTREVYVYLPLGILAGFDEIIQLNKAPSMLTKHLFALPQSLAKIQERTMRQKGSCCHNLKCTRVTMFATRKGREVTCSAEPGMGKMQIPLPRGEGAVVYLGKEEQH